MANTVDPIYRNLIQFVRQGTASDLHEQECKHKLGKSAETLNGDDIKQFYEDLTQTDSVSCEQEKSLNTSQSLDTDRILRRGSKKPQVSSKNSSTTKRSSRHSVNTSHSRRLSHRVSLPSAGSETKPISHKERQYFQLFQAAQAGDEDTISKLIKEGLSINHTDFYGWSLLMCAAKEGHSSIVNLCLKLGADKHVLNKDGQTAAALARLSNHNTVATFIDNYGNTGDLTAASCPQMGKEETASGTAFFCDVCNLEFTDISRASHQTSTIHLFNRGRKPQGPSYLIPESNKGFQLLVRTGWSVGQGLGPTGEGAQYPIKTRLKYDRAGLGGDKDMKEKARITHFNPNDTSSVKTKHGPPARIMSARKCAQRDMRGKERRQRRQEQRLRWEFSNDFS